MNHNTPDNSICVNAPGISFWGEIEHTVYFKHLLIKHLLPRGGLVLKCAGQGCNNRLNYNWGKCVIEILLWKNWRKRLIITVSCKLSPTVGSLVSVIQCVWSNPQNEQHFVFVFNYLFLHRFHKNIDHILKSSTFWTLPMLPLTKVDIVTRNNWNRKFLKKKN